MKYIKFLLLLFIPIILNAQDDSNPALKIPMPTSPNTAGIERFDKIAVNYFTGTPDISIPLYTIQSRHLSIPIVLRYHASGIKVTDVASWVGLGWSLEVGGQISRNVVGLPDDITQGILNVSVRSSGSINPTNDEIWLGQVNRKEIDQESDIYSYSIPGKSGNFVFSHYNGSPTSTILVPFDDVIIDHSPNLTSFTLKDASGLIYTFGAIEQTNNATGGVPGYLMLSNTAWKLSSIQDPNNTDQISFSYYSPSGIAYDDYLDYFTIEDGAEYGVTYNYYYVNQYIINSEKNVQTIIFQNGKVEFTLDTNHRSDLTWDNRLQKIVIYALRSSTYIPIRTIEFVHSYFSVGSSNLEKRLKLDAVQIKDASDVIIENYGFTYNTSVNLPIRNSRARDYWGYYNGQTGNTDLIPTQTIDYTLDGITTQYMSIGHANRSASETNMKANILTRITYPTGGYSDFTYEANKYDDNGNTVNGGGLRILQISSKPDSSSTPVIYTYKYGSNENGKGRLNFDLRLSTFKTENHLKRPYINSVGCVDRRYRNYMSNSTVDSSPWDGSIVFYSTVSEFIGDITNNQGKTIYKYSDFADQITALQSGTIVKISYHWKRGLLLSKTDYRNTNSVYYPSKKTTNSYQFFNEESYITGFFNALNWDYTSGYPKCQYIPGRTYFYNNYSVYTGDNKLKNSTEYIYDNLDTTKYVSTQTSYYFNNKQDLQVSRKELYDSHNNLQKDSLIYSDDAGSGAPSQMVTRHMINQVIKQKHYVNSVIKNKVDYGYVYFNNQVQLQSISDFKTGTTEVVKYTYSYDDYGNVRQKGIWGSAYSVTPTTYLWSYNNTLPVAQIENCYFGDLFDPGSLTTTFITNLGNYNSDISINAALNTIRTAVTTYLPMSSLTTYNHLTQIGVSLIADPANIKMTYYYDNYGRLITIKDYQGYIVKNNRYNYAH